MTGIPDEDLTTGQRFALALSRHLIAECNRFCCINGVSMFGVDAVGMSTVAVSAALIGVLANHPENARMRWRIARSLVDGHAENLIKDVHSINKKG